MENVNESLVDNGSFYLPGSYSTYSNNVDVLFYVIFFLSVFIASLISKLFAVV